MLDHRHAGGRRDGDRPPHPQGACDMKFDLGTSHEGSSSLKQFYLLVEEDGLPPLLVTVEADTQKYVGVARADLEFAFNDRHKLRAGITARGRHIITEFATAGYSLAKEEP